MMFITRKIEIKNHVKLEIYLNSFKNFRNKVIKDYDFQRQEINNYIFDAKTHQTSIFKEYLIIDDIDKHYFKRYSL